MEEKYEIIKENRREMWEEEIVQKWEFGEIIGSGVKMEGQKETK